MSDPITRRVLHAAVLLGAIGALGAPGSASGQELKELEVSVGRQPWAAGNSPITQYMMDNELFEKAARELGYELTVDYRDYPSAMPQVEAFVGGNLDFGMWGNTPIVRGIAQGQPWTVLNVGEGHLRFVVVTRPDSGIHNVEDLKGKTVGALLGGDPYNALSQILRGELGTGDPRELGINIINTPTQAQAASVPAGMDAAIAILPLYLKAKEELGVVGIVNSFGYTEDGYKGEVGEGAGHLLPSVKQSQFYPDGFYLHRSFWVVQNSLLEAHPDVVTAFVVAQQQAVEALMAMEPTEIHELAAEYWDFPPEMGAQVIDDEVLFIRGWVWPTEGDAGALLAISQFMVEGGLIEEPLTWDQVKDAMRPAADLVKKAWDMTGKVPPEAEFQATGTPDIRGLPVWEMDKWAERG
jgi:ABC-type nitrate/sulfonate/bicarbonate transport system substrate-binding protein